MGEVSPVERAEEGGGEISRREAPCTPDGV